jgi:hypothetical protein
LIEPGSQNITTQVMIDQLMLAVPYLSVTHQSEWLLNWGVDELVAEGSRYWDKHKSAPDIAAMKMRSRANESKELTNQDGLGAFSVMEFKAIRKLS